MRKIVLKMLTGQVTTIESSAVTFAQLKEDIVNAGVEVQWDNAAFVERSTKASFGKIPGAILPSGDIFFFVVPERTKLGLDVESTSYNDLRRTASVLNKTESANISLQGSKMEIKERILNFLNKSVPTTGEDGSAKVNIFEEIESKAISIIDLVDSLRSCGEEKKAAYVVTEEQLEKEAKELGKFFK